jgi:hypothetical protein
VVEKPAWRRLAVVCRQLQMRAAAATKTGRCGKSSGPQLRMKPSHSPSAQASVFSIDSP